MATKGKGKAGNVERGTRTTKAKKEATSVAKPAPRQRGRPTIKTQTVLDEVLNRLTAGEPLARICADPHMPAASTIHAWLHEDESFSVRYARAREAGFDALALEMLRIADTPQMGTNEKFVRDDEGEMILAESRTEDMLGHRQLQVGTRRWLLEKWDPGRYGNRQKVEHDVVGNLADELAAARERLRRR